MTHKNSILEVLTLVGLVLSILSPMMATPTVVQAQGPGDCPANMISYWKLDDGSGTTAADYYDGHDGTLFPIVDGPTWTTGGIVDGALEFDGIDDRAQVDSSTDFDIPADGSFSAFLWFKKTTDCGSNQASQNEVMLDRTYPGQHGSNTWWFGCDKDSDKLAVMFYPASATGDDGVIMSDAAVDDGQWHHGGWVYDGQANELKLYLDGEWQGTDTIDLQADFDSTNPLCIGGYDIDGTCDTYEYNGILDEVAIYNRALTDAEILGHFNDRAGRHYCERFGPTIYSTEETEGTVGELYTYDVDAIGNPPPTYTLTVAPTGMTIDELTGEIGWTPTATGDYDVVVEAHNTEGVDQQSFVLSVSEPPPFALRINCGGSTVVDGDITWESSDPYITGGANYTFATSSVDTTTNSIEEPIPPLEVYKACRHQSPHTYSFPSVPNGDYIVRIHWIDQVTSAGLREIDYDIEGVRVEEDWDIYAEAGGQFVAIDKEYEVTVSDGDGLQITSSAASGDAFESAIEITVRQDEAPQITSSPVTQASVGCLYTYDVEADGYPPPTYTLTIAPTGMTIDENTGVIEWTPDAAGSHSVTVEASNSERTDEQSFSIDVGTCPCGMTNYWTLDETGSPTSFADSYGEDDGVCSSHGCPTPADGQVNGGQAIDGGSTGVGIDIPAHPSKDAPFDWSKDDSFSVEFWMKRSGTISENDVIIGRDEEGAGASSLHWWCGLNTSGVPSGNLVATDSDGQSFTGSTNVNDGQWHHLVFVRDATSGQNLTYVDGQLDGTKDKTSYSAGFDSATAAVNIGWLSLDTKYTYDGVVDEVALYNKALSLSEIQEHYHKGQANVGYCEAPEGLDYGDAPDPSYQTLLANNGARHIIVPGFFLGAGVDAEPDGQPDATAGGDDNDGNDDEDGVVFLSPLELGSTVSVQVTASASGVLNAWMDFDGNGDWADAGEQIFTDASLVAGTNDLTFPVPPTATPGQTFSRFRFSTVGGLSYEGLAPDGEVEDYLVEIEAPPELGSITIEKVTNPAAGTGFEFTGTGGLSSFSLDDDGSQAFTNLTAGDYDVTETSMPAGWELADVTCTGGSTTPIADGVTIHLAASEHITCTFTNQLGQPPTCPAEMISYHKLEESATPYADSLGGPDATCTNCPVQTTGIVGSAQQFDGDDDEVDVADNDQYDWAADDSFSMEYWMKKGTACTDNEVIVGRDNGSGLHWWTGCEGSGKVRFQLRDVNGNGIYIGGVGDVINDGEWHHLVFVRDESTDENRIYVDGVQVHQGTHDYTAGFGSSVPLNIGYLNLSGHYRYDGLLDEVALYDRALSATEIQEHHSRGRAGWAYCAPPAIAPTIVSSAVTQASVGCLYTYDVDASGNPPPAYTLTTKPTGMTIDENTGLISWTPDTVGDYDVTVEASNSEGTATQPYSIEVKTCPCNMTHYWKLDETSSGAYVDFYDASDGVCASGGTCPTPTTDGKVEGAQVFSGGTGVDIPDDDSFEWGVDDSFTVEFWMNRPGSISGNEVIVGRQGPTHPNPHIWIGINSGKVANFSLHANNSDDASVQGTTDLTQGAWHHIVAVRDAQADQLLLYVDGVEENSVPHTYSSGFETTTELNLGWLRLGGGFHYNGKLDEVAIYNRALNLAEIQGHYQEGLASVGYCDAPDGLDYGDAPDTNYLTLVASNGARHVIVPGLFLGGGVDAEADGQPDPNALGDDNDGNDDEDGVTFTSALNPGSGATVDVVTSQAGGVLNAWLDFNGNGTWADPGEQIFTDQALTAGTNPLGFSVLAGATAGTTHARFRFSSAGGLSYEGLALDGEVEDYLVEIEAPPELGSMTIVKETDPDGGTSFDFSGDLGSFTLNDDGSRAFTDVPVGSYDVTESLLSGWMLANIECQGDLDGGSAIDLGTATVSIDLDADEDIVCTFTNEALACPASMVSYWKMDDATVPPIVDSYGSNNGTCSGGACPTPVTGIVNGSLSFDGGDQVDVADDPSLKWSDTDSLTVEAWVNTTQNFAGNKVFVGKHRNSGEAYWWLGGTGDTGTVEFEFADSDNVGDHLSSGTSINNGAWHHIAAVISRDDDTVYLYVDGALKNSVTLPFTGDFSSTRALNIGHYLNSYHYNGLLDEVAIYKRALSASEILGHYNAGAGRDYCEKYAPTIASLAVTQASVGCLYIYDVDASGNPPPAYTLTVAPSGMTINENTGVIEWTPTSDQAGSNAVTVEATNSEGTDTHSFSIEVGTCPCAMNAYYKLDETSAPYADFLGGPNANCSNCPVAATGIVSGAQQFDGSDDEVDVPDNDQFEWGKDDSFSIEFWMKTSASCSGNKVIVGRDDGTLHWWVGCNGSGNVAHFGLKDTGGTYKGVSGTSAINDNVWHHIVAVRDESTDENQIYVDGVKENWLTHDYSHGFSGDAELNIGYLMLSGHYRYNGIADEVAVYDRALTDAEIEQHYQAGAVHQGYCEIGPVAPEITSSPVTQAYVGVPYSYDVEATGYPAPTYTLTVAPPGTTIDEDSGEISWTPTATGDYDVTVQASNGVTPDATQSFTIHVAAITPCPLDMTSYWRLDETSSGSYEDSYDDNDGTCAGACPSPTADAKVNGGQVFDGDTTGIDVPADTSFDWAPNDSFSIEFWMKRPGVCAAFDVPHNEVIVGRDDASTDLHWWVGVSCNHGGKALFGLVDKDAGGDDAWAVGDTDVTGGLWHHIVAVRNADENEISIYVDGKEEDSASATFSAGFDSSTAALNLGWLNLSPGYHFEGTLDEVALYNRPLSETEIKTHYYLARGYCETCESPVRIMPLGDSITVGNASGVVPDDEAHWVSYRKDLWESLGTAGYDVDFVGGQSHGYTFDPPFDSDHEGHGGWTDSQIRDNVVSFLTANPADVVLLHIGTNGLSSDPDQVEEILDNIDSVSEDITVVLARIINRRDGSTTTTQFNDNVEAMALARMDPTSPDYTGDKIIIVDMENGAGIVYGQAPSNGDMWDNLHPYETGYAKMANVWLYGDSYGSDGLEDFLPICAPPTPYAPTITSDPVTEAYVGWPYSYDVEADGYPAPTFALTEYPSGMTVDAATGLIEWTPDAAGDYNVTVQASNGVTPNATQSFTITVAEAPVCPVDMISYWKLDETAAPYADYLGGPDATCSNCPSAVVGTVGEAQQFDGSDDAVNVPDNDQFEWSSSASFSIEYWMKKDGPAHQVIVGRDDGGTGGTGTHWWVGTWGDGYAAFVLIATDGSGSDSTNFLHGTKTYLADNEWHHVVAVRDATSGQNRIYIDGELEQEKSVAYTAGFNAGTDLNIGYMAYHGSPGYHYGGALDEVAIYDRVLSLDEIQQHHQAGLAGQGYCEIGPVAPEITSSPVTQAYVGVPYSYDVEATGSPVPTYTLTVAPLGMDIDEVTGEITWMPTTTGTEDVTVVAVNSEGSDPQSFTITVNEAPVCPADMISYWKLDETGSPTTFEDYYGDNDATCSGACPSPTTDGKVNGAQQFSRPSGTGINAPGASFNWNQDDSFSIEFWMKKQSACSGSDVPANEVIVGRDGGGTDLHWWAGVWCSDSPQGVALFQLRDENHSGDHVAGTTNLIDGEWHHVVAVRDESENVNRIYVDGVEEGTLPYDYTGDFFSPNAALEIGHMGSAFYYDGTLDEVAIYDRALTETEIQQHYQNGLAGLGYCVPSEPVAPQITSTPVTEAIVGLPYTYDVDATGYPVPTYTLSVAPAGMTINETTGVISWMPVFSGTYAVTVEAHNTEGMDDQSFEIEVLAIGPCPSDMLSYWKLDEISGSVFADFYDDNDASCPTGYCPDFATGVIAGALDFNGTDDYLTVPDDGSFDWASDASFSIELWANFTNVSSRNKVMIGRDEDGGYPHWWLGANQNTGYANFNLLDENRNGVAVTGDTPINDGQWHHIVAVRDESLDQNRLYVDGRLVDAKTHNYTAGFAAETSLDISYMAYNHTPDYFYDGLLDEIAIYNRALTEREIREHSYVARPYCGACDEPVRIMPCGDSITYDNHSGDTRPEGERISYRMSLWYALMDAGYNVDFVGSQSAGYDIVPPFDPDNEGWPGWRDDQIATHIYGWLEANPADVVLLHIGTNDLNASPDDVEDILDEVDRYEQDYDAAVTVILARIINRINYSQTTTDFNTNIAAMAQLRIDNQSDRIIIVDMENGAGLIYSEDTTPPYDDGDMYDNLHPNDDGYAKMANVWLNGDSYGSLGLDDFLPICAPPEPEPPVITSTPVTEAYQGKPYMYDVEATGFPPPTYTLSLAPGGMTVDETSGLITWTPAATGDYDVTVEASNVVGMDDQSFTITVSEAPPCPLDMTSYWKLDEMSSGTYLDFYDGNNNGHCAGVCPTPATDGRVLNAQVFNGTSTGIDVPADASFDWGKDDSFTIEFWTKRPGDLGGGTSNNEVIVGRDDASTDLHWWFGIRNTYGYAHFQLADKTHDTVTLEGPDVTDGEWHHLVGVRDGAAGINRLYVDGVEVASEPHTYLQGFDSATAALNLGWLNLSGGYHFEGTLDEVALYNRALSDAEIYQHYLNGLAGKGYCEALGPAVVLTKKANVNMARVGDDISYTYTILNVGGENLDPITLVDDKLGTIIATTDGITLAAGTSATFTETYTVQVSDLPGPIVNLATATGYPDEGEPVTDIATVSVELINPSIQVIKEADPLAAGEGDVVTYIYTISNTGDSILTNVTLTDDKLGEIELTPAQVTDGLQVLYTFEEGSGTTVHDVSGAGTPLDLTIGDEANVSWIPGGGLSLDASTIVASDDPATKIVAACQTSSELTIEAWVKPANTTQGGGSPPRIITLSANPSARNFSLHQDETDYLVRLRTTGTDQNGMPELRGGGATTDLSHVVFTRDAGGVDRIYVNSIEVVNRSSISGDFSNWDDTMHFALGNEFEEDRTWLGEYHLIAIYNRALSQAEVNQNYEAGGGSVTLLPDQSITATATYTVLPGDCPIVNEATASGQPPIGDPVTNTATATVECLQKEFSWPLVEGWNLISFPISPVSTVITEVLSTIEGSYDLVYAYDAMDTADPWKKYNVAAPPFLNDLTEVNETMGLWIRATEAVTLTVSGLAPSSTDLALHTGWNLVGYPSQTTRPLTEALQSIQGKYDLIYAYDATDTADPWKKYNVAAPPFLNDLTEMGSGYGYWISVTEDCVWTVEYE